MIHSKNFFKFKGYYDKGLWTKEDLKDVVGKKNGITALEYFQITGEEYVDLNAAEPAETIEE